MIEDIAQNKDFVGHTLSKDQFTAIDAFCRAFVTAHWRALNDRALRRPRPRRPWRLARRAYLP